MMPVQKSLTIKYYSIVKLFFNWPVGLDVFHWSYQYYSEAKQIILGSFVNRVWSVGLPIKNPSHPPSCTDTKRDTILIGKRVLVIRFVARGHCASQWLTAAETLNHETVTQCCLNVGPPSAKLAQHLNSIGWRCLLCAHPDAAPVRSQALLNGMIPYYRPFGTWPTDE